MSRSRLLALLSLLAAPAATGAQQLPLKREVPAISWAGCPRGEPTTNVTASQRQNAERLGEDARQASLLGDKAAALDLLNRAAAMDPSSRSLAYRVARALDELERPREALIAYCRYLTLAPDAPEAQEVRDRTRALGTPSGFTVPANAARAFQTGITHFDARQFAEAETAFGQASEASRDWSAAVYNRAVARLALGRTAAAAEDLRRFLELSPTAPEFNTVLDLLATFRQVAPPPFNPSSALMQGLLLPGLGHFTTGRAGKGALFLGAATGAVAAGFMVTRLSVDCLSPPVNGRCPDDQIVDQARNRPYLVPAIGAAVAIGVIGAIDAYRGARKLNDEAAKSLRVGADGRPQGPSLVMPRINLGFENAHIDLIRVRF